MSDLDRRVEITVRDKTSSKKEVFLCNLELLRVTMRYFDPLITKLLKEETKQGGVAAGTSGKPLPKDSLSPISLKANCDVTVFRWLVAWMEGKNPHLSFTNVISILLASNFLGMSELIEEALAYIRDHLVDVILSSVDMECVPGELVGRLCGVMRETDLALCLLTLYEDDSACHANRRFISAVLRNYVEDRVTKMHAKAVVALASSSTQRNNNRMGSTIANGDSGLRWCCLCRCLYDEGEIERLARAHQCHHPACPAIAVADSGKSGSGPSGTSSASAVMAAALTSKRRVGPCGELLEGHACSRIPAEVSQPPLTWGELEVERWAWQVLGATKFVSCKRCRCLVALIDTPTHKCSSLSVEFTSPDRSHAEDMAVLLNWYNYAVVNGVYDSVGGLIPLRCPAVLEQELAKETITMPGSLLRGASGSTGENRASGSSGTAGKQVSLEMMPMWSACPDAVRETVVTGRRACMDVDVQNYYDREFMQELHTFIASQASSTGLPTGVNTGAAGSAAPDKLRVYPFVPIPSPVPSPRPYSSSAALSGGGGGGGNSSALGDRIFSGGFSGTFSNSTGRVSSSGPTRPRPAIRIAGSMGNRRPKRSSANAAPVRGSRNATTK